MTTPPPDALDDAIASAAVRASRGRANAVRVRGTGGVTMLDAYRPISSSLPNLRMRSMSRRTSTPSELEAECATPARNKGEAKMGNVAKYTEAEWAEYQEMAEYRSRAALEDAYDRGKVLGKKVAAAITSAFAAGLDFIPPGEGVRVDIGHGPSFFLTSEGVEQVDDDTIPW